MFAPLSATADRVLGPTSRLGLELRWKVGEAKLYDPARDALGDYDHVYAELGRWLAPDHPRMLSLRTARAMSMTPTSRHAEAVAELREVIRLKTEVYGTPHASTLIARRALGQALTYSGRFEEALEEYREQYRLFSEPPRSPSDIDAHWSAMLICGTLMQLSRFDEARHRTLEVIAALERAGIDEGWSSAQLSVSMYMLAESSFALRDFAGAREQLTGALEHSGASLAQPDAPGETIRYWRIDAALTLAEDARDGTRRGLRPAPAIAPGGGPRPMITLLTTLYALRDGELEAVPEALALLAAEPRFLGSPDALPTRLLDDLAAGLRALPPEHRSDAEPFLAALAAARER